MAVSCTNKKGCVDEFNCPKDGSCPDFQIKRHDTKPSLEIEVKDCSDPIDLTDTVVEASMWANAKLRAAIDSDDTSFCVADNIGFQQSMVGDVVVVEQSRNPEQMLVTGHDEANKLIRVQRGYNGSPAIAHAKGTKIKIFRVLNAVGSTQMTTRDVLQTDGTTEEDVLIKSELIYEWAGRDTCLPGCYLFEFKLLKMTSVSSTSMGMFQGLFLTTPSTTPSFTSFDSSELGCDLGTGVEWVRRFPVDKAGFMVKITDSPTSELVV